MPKLENKNLYEKFIYKKKGIAKNESKNPRIK